MPARRHDGHGRSRETPYTQPEPTWSASAGTATEDTTQRNGGRIDPAADLLGNESQMNHASADVQMEFESVVTGAKVVEIAAFSSDLTLVVGAEKMRLQVLSHVLGAASKKLEELVGNAVKTESQNLETELNTRQECVIRLPQDDANAMTIICYIIHLRGDLMPTGFTYDQVFAMAKIVQKYELHRAASLVAGQWFVYDARNGIVGNGKLLLAADLMDNYTAYLQISHGLLSFTIEPYYELIEAMPEENLWRLAYLLEDRRKMYRDYLVCLIEYPCLSQDCNDPNCTGAKMDDCICTFSKDFTLALRAVVVEYKMTCTVINKNSLWAIVLILRNLRESSFEKLEAYKECNGRHRKTLHEALEEKLSYVTHGLQGFCLFCTRSGLRTVHIVGDYCPTK